MDLRAEIEAGRRAEVADQSAQIMYRPPMGFGALPAGDRLEVAADAAVEARTVHFIWPFPAIESERLATVEGDLTPTRRTAAEALALGHVLPLGEGATRVLWRVVPEWTSERDFESDKTSHRLRLRGTFVWLPA